MTNPAMTSPVSFDAHVLHLPKKGMPVVIDATESQCAQLAETPSLAKVKSFHAELLVEAWKRNGVSVTGRVTARIVQSCIITLEPIDAVVDEEISAVFLPETSKLGRESFGEGGEILLDVEGEDGPETFSGDHIDVGALCEEMFALGINPYPRKPGAALNSQQGEPVEEGVFQQKLRKLFPNN